MKKSITIAATIAAIALAMPAHAAWTPIRADIVRDAINNLAADINRADNNDTISEREAADLRSRQRALRDQFQRMNRNGLTRAEVNTLQDRTNYIRNRLNMERADWDRHVH